MALYRALHSAYSHYNDDKCYDWSRNVIAEISNKTAIITVFVLLRIELNELEKNNNQISVDYVKSVILLLDSNFLRLKRDFSSYLINKFLQSKLDSE